MNKHLKCSKRPTETRAELTVGFIKVRLVTPTLSARAFSVRGVETGV